MREEVECSYGVTGSPGEGICTFGFILVELTVKLVVINYVVLDINYFGVVVALFILREKVIIITTATGDKKTRNLFVHKLRTSVVCFVFVLKFWWNVEWKGKETGPSTIDLSMKK